MNSEERKKRNLIAEARELIAHTRTYNFGMRSADKLAHEVAPALADALEASLTVPDGDARETVMKAIRAGREARQEWWTVAEDVSDPPSDDDFIADAILATFPVLSRAVAPEPEWEYNTQAENGFLYSETTQEDAQLSAEMSRRVHDYPGSTTTRLIRHVVRRRKAGPWEPLTVGGESDGE
ncbi:hypothetical protein MUN77_01525 [Leucobacter allii]|uniref:hypothetical protein n=1 Tax=Leucobacter allii TaxID=2932247 RepID=UPI001FD03299|nr:hypothetical protein [Leucobacter allii]UOR02039.1 hypothetical protein MUN77_01525 [Leucobacter allii]